jgi:hypothetical protein
METPMHLDEEQLQRLLHGELSSGEQRGAREHLAKCTECHQRLVAAERDESEIFALLRQVDHPVPMVDAEHVAARARGTGVAWGRRAAGILLFLGIAGAAYAAPGSPVPDWVKSVVAWAGGEDRPAQEPKQVETRGAQMAGIAAVPGREFVIAFESTEPGGQARVSLTDGVEVSVRAPIGAARFTSAANRLVIANAGLGATFEIQIPRDAPRVEIRVAGERLWLKAGSQIVTQGISEVESSYLLPLSQP